MTDPRTSAPAEPTIDFAPSAALVEPTVDFASSAGLLGDTPARDYSRKLRLFNSFAEPELRRAIASLDLHPGMRVLDAGCGTGEALIWLAEAVQPDGEVVGCDLASAHVATARALLSSRPRMAAQTAVLQADLLQPPFSPASFDLVWSVNTIHHLRNPQRGVGLLTALLRPGGCIALGQSSMLPDMYFAWDARLERVTNDAVRRYYRDRYGVTEHDLASTRALLGLLRRAGLRVIAARTYTIERIAPVDSATRAYVLDAIFRNTWGERLRQYLSAEDYLELTALCNPDGADFALCRPDFHFLQTLTVVSGTV